MAEAEEETKDRGTDGSARAEASTLTVVLLALAACLVAAMSDGIKNNYGIMLSSIIENSGLSYSTVSFVLAVGQLFYGMIQPAFGIMAERKGGTVTLLTGVCMMLAGLLLLPYCTSAWSLVLCLGLLLPAGTGATSYGILIGCITPRIPARTVSIVSGVVNASSGVGNALLAPVIQSFLETGGLSAAMVVLAIPTALMIPVCLYVGRRPDKGGRRGAGANDADEAGRGAVEPAGTDAAAVTTSTAVGKAEDGEAPAGTAVEPAAAATAEAAAAAATHQSVRSLFADAFGSRTYRLLMVGFFTCGFHMALISNHLPSQFTSYGISEAVSSYAFSVYGVVTMIGSIISGALTGRFRQKNVLGTYYGSRSIITLVFLALPKTAPVIFGYAVALGLTGAATVPPVSGIIGREFGAERVGTLYGFVFFIHQIGGFLGSWLGGLCVDAFGSYVPIWIVDIALSAVAAGASFLIREE